MQEPVPVAGSIPKGAGAARHDSLEETTASGAVFGCWSAMTTYAGMRSATASLAWSKVILRTVCVQRTVRGLSPAADILLTQS
jgi:hypothetical protein